MYPILDGNSEVEDETEQNSILNNLPPLQANSPSLRTNSLPLQNARQARKNQNLNGKLKLDSHSILEVLAGWDILILVIR